MDGCSGWAQSNKRSEIIMSATKTTLTTAAALAAGIVIRRLR